MRLYPGIKSTMSEIDPRRLLGDFLKMRRARLDPAIVGLPTGGRRRTPGLRREEVAMLARISPTWLTWLEQGRDIAASPSALDRLAGTLRLSTAERAHLFQLAGRHDPRQPDPADADTALLPLLDASIAALSVPAYAMDQHYDLLAWNLAAADLFVGWLDRPGPHNLLRFLFLDPRARQLVVDWPARTGRVLAELRADHGRHLTDPVLARLIDELSTGSVDFATGWAGSDVRDREGGERLFCHPTRGLLRFSQVILSVAARPDLRLVILHPSTAAPGG